MKENQEKIVEAIEFKGKPMNAITFDGEKLPELPFYPDEDDEEDEYETTEEDLEELPKISITDEFGEVKPSTSEDKEVKPSKSEKKPTTLKVDLDRGISDEYKNLLHQNYFKLPSKIFEQGHDTKPIEKKVIEKIKSKKIY